ncbi:MAG: SIMPL domain-containing protein [Chloroflexota bacterium]
MSFVHRISIACVLLLGLVGCAPATQVVPTPIPPPTQTAQPALPQQVQIIQPEKRSISVLGKGEIKVTPDMVRISLRISTEDREITKAASTNHENTRNILSILEKYNVEEKDILTSYLSIHPDYDYRTSRITGYSADHTIQVTLRDLTQFEPLVIEILETGVSSVYGVKFQVSDLEKYEEHARTLAIQSAKDKATSMAKDLGQEIGEPLSIQEAIERNDTSYNYFSSALALLVYPSESLEDPSVLLPGQLTITAVVTVEFALK